MNDVNQVPRNFMPIIGIIVIVLVAGYYAFLGIDTLGLEQLQATALVVDKTYRAAGTTYSTQIIGNRPHSIPQATPEAYVLTLELDGQRTETAVSRQVYDAVRTNQRLQVTYERRRLTGIPQVSAIKLGGN